MPAVAVEIGIANHIVPVKEVVKPDIGACKEQFRGGMLRPDLSLERVFDVQGVPVADAVGGLKDIKSNVRIFIYQSGHIGGNGLCDRVLCLFVKFRWHIPVHVVPVIGH